MKINRKFLCRQTLSVVCKQGEKPHLYPPWEILKSKIMSFYEWMYDLDDPPPENENILHGRYKLSYVLNFRSKRCAWNFRWIIHSLRNLSYERKVKNMKHKQKRYVKKVFASVLALCMTFTVLPSSMVRVKAASSWNALLSGYTTDENGVMAYNILNNASDGKSSTVDLLGKVNGKWLKTTYSNYGYEAKLKGDASMTTTPVFINDGRYIKLEYTVTAKNDTTVNLSVDADIQIGGDDYASITKFTDNSGFKMVNVNKDEGRGAQFNFYGKMSMELKLLYLRIGLVNIPIDEIIFTIMLVSVV